MPFRRRLPYPLYVKGGTTLTTLGDARAYMLKLDDHQAIRQHWQRAAELMLDERAALSAIVRQLHLALLLDTVLDTSKTEIPER